MWYTSFTKTALRKHNLRVDFRVYAGEEETPPVEQEISNKLKSLLSSAIIKGLDVMGIVSKYGNQVGQLANKLAIESKIDLKIIAGQDYISADKVKAVFYNIKENIPPGLNIQEAISRVKKQGGKTMLYDVSKNVARAISSWQSTEYAPDFIEIYNAHSKAFKDLDIDYPRVISSASRSGSELENIPVYTELSRKRLQDFGFLLEAEGENYIPDYLRNTQQDA